MSKTFDWAFNATQGDLVLAESLRSVRKLNTALDIGAGLVGVFAAIVFGLWLTTM